MKGIIFKDGASFAEIGDTESLIKESIYRIIMTNPQERPNNPSFGLGFKNFLFQNMKIIPTNFLEGLKNQIQAYEPRIIVFNLAFRQISENALIFTMKYAPITNYSDERTVDFVVSDNV